MNVTSNVTGGESLTLFLLVSAMLVYRTVDLLSAHAKLDQLALRTRWWDGSELTFSTIRRAHKQCEKETRLLLPRFRFLMIVREEFLLGMMVLYLGLFAVLGLSVLLFEGVQSGIGLSLVVAIGTATISLIASAINYFIEKVKISL